MTEQQEPVGTIHCRNGTCGPDTGCPGCVRASLRSLTALYERCAAELTRLPPQLTERISGNRRGGITLDERAMATRTAILRALVTWSARVSAERCLPVPGGRRVAPLVVFLDGQLDWLLAQPSAPSFARGVAELTRAARAVTEPEPVRCWDAGGCPAPGCDRMVRATQRPGRRPRLSCDAGHLWQPSQWLGLESRPSVPAGTA
ncbi:hypothetical protein GCM10009716_27670 [Streptomyces sodiiphilus]|uniref:Uncharacterized protein n=1 Tax=Streptomyces sodiiphilus TaxID=226217 RepID=A0ABP5AN35_9ACTN